MSNKITNAIAVFGYNNTRLYDVEKIRELARKLHQASLIIIKEGVTSADREVTPFCIDAKPESRDLASALKLFVAQNNLKLIGCLPFSDKGVVGAAHAAQTLGLFHDDAISSDAMLNKHSFRELEKAFEADTVSYKKPFYSRINSAPALFEALTNFGSYFIKPSAEGNSRGCMKIESRSDLLLWLESNGHYIKDGVVCEEYLSAGGEYSFDGVNSNYWLTEKFTTSGAYRAEYQQIVPAPLPERLSEKIHSILIPLIKHLGSNGGAFHHEFFILKNEQIASVEPNRRPAGMWIWDLAEWSFESFKPWTQWLDLCCGKSPLPAALNRSHYSGVRGVISTSNGRIATIDEAGIRSDLDEALGAEASRLMIFKKPEDVACMEPKDNSDFLAFVATRDENYHQLREKLDLAEKLVLKHITFEGQS